MKARKHIMGLAVLTVAVVMLAGCFTVPRGSQSASSTAQSVVSASSEPQSSESTPAAATMQEIDIGDTVTTANIEATINYAMFANRVDAREGNSLIRYAWQTADEGKILLDLSVNIKNLQQAAFTGTNVLGISADYNGGYIYDHAIEAVERAGTLEPTGSLMGTSVKIDPLETVEVRYVLDVPAEVAENVDAPLFLIITIEGVPYRLDIR